MAAAGQKDAAVNDLQKNKSLDAYWKYLNPKQPAKKQTAQTAQPEATTAQPAAPAAQPEATTAQPAAPAKAAGQPRKKAAAAAQPAPAAAEQPKAAAPAGPPQEDVVKEERDRFFNIINRIEKLYD